VRTVRLEIAFVGTAYEGWQSQRKGKTVQETVERLLERILKEKVPVTASSRTDSGVHARGLVAHFKTKSALPDIRLREALNFYLPKDIAVLSAGTVGSDFHARYGAKSKIYRYQIWNDPVRPVFEAPFAFWSPTPLDVAEMRKAARHLKGRHDFSAFCDMTADPRKTHVRTVKRLVLSKKGPLITLEIEGDGFLTHMVRIIAGTLIQVGRKQIPAARVPKILRSKDRKLAGPTAKAHGLTLVKVKY